ncbi:hypothetical protein MNVM_24240 [Mycobacterium novum]|uniref:Uncharacterized protein n=1 Tax=Mycobacterium novum TaxID=2492438 RepID=A0A7I7JNL2_9MYCO|nr:hypothetical protein MNVM_24240 [Mycobacterium novum]
MAPTAAVTSSCATTATACAAKTAGGLGAICATCCVAGSSDSRATDATATIASPSVARTRAISIAHARMTDIATCVAGGIVRASETAPTPVSTATGATAGDR